MKQIDTKAALESAAKVFAEAFHNYPIYTFCFPDEIERKRVLLLLFQASVKYISEYAYYDGDENNPRAILLINSPTAKGPDAWQAIGLLFDYGYRLPLRRTLKMLSIFNEFERARIKLPHWYLQAIAVSPTEQGTGIGTRTLQFARSLAGDLPICLETSTSANARFYLSHGYEQQKQFVTLNGKGTEVWTFVSR